MFPSWSLLVFAIATEVLGTLAMNESGQSDSLWMYGVMYVFICASYILLSFALRKIAVGVAIAIWEALGVTLITIISVTFLGESLNVQKCFGLILGITGIILLKFGEKQPKSMESL